MNAKKARSLRAIVKQQVARAVIKTGIPVENVVYDEVKHRKDFNIANPAYEAVLHDPDSYFADVGEEGQPTTLELHDVDGNVVRERLIGHYFNSQRVIAGGSRGLYRAFKARARALGFR